MYGAGVAWSRLFLPGAGGDPILSKPDSAPGPRPSGAGAAQKSDWLWIWIQIRSLFRRFIKKKLNYRREKRLLTEKNLPSEFRTFFM